MQAGDRHTDRLATVTAEHGADGNARPLSRVGPTDPRTGRVEPGRRDRCRGNTDGDTREATTGIEEIASESRVQGRAASDERVAIERATVELDIQQREQRRRDVVEVGIVEAGPVVVDE